MLVCKTCTLYPWKGAAVSIQVKCSKGLLTFVLFKYEQLRRRRERGGAAVAGCRLLNRVSSAANFARMLAMTVLSFVAALAVVECLSDCIVVELHVGDVMGVAE